jgi:hypothetical protein
MWRKWGRKRNGSAKRHDRIAFRVGGRQARHEVRDTGAGCGDRDPGLARHASNPARDERGILFVPTDNGLDFRADETVENSIDVAARDSENVGDTLGFKGTNDWPRAGLLGPGSIGDLRRSLCCRSLLR